MFSKDESVDNEGVAMSKGACWALVEVCALLGAILVYFLKHFVAFF